MKRYSTFRLAALIGLALAFAAAPAAVAETDDARSAEELFEARIRPLLASRCVECHGPDEQEAGVRLDTQAAFRAGGASGAIVNADHPDESRLLAVIRYAGDVQMPPDGKLTLEEIADLEQWVRMGAPWPTAAEPSSPDSAGRAASESADERLERIRAGHWAVQPVRQPDLPEVANREWGESPIDRFVLAQLEAAGLAPSPAADPRTLLRRAWFDLVGLPPPADEVERFERDRGPEAFARAIDRLLASPLYGQRWGRHWLDVARYSDTKGYVFTEDRRYPYAYTYRNYVIDAFNRDLPFDQFVLQQIAADQLELPAGQRDALAAMGFLTVGRRFSNNTHDIIDDRIDVITRGLLGLTVTCARCHDHKYDPIPAADYYSLYGVFASSVEPGDPPLIAPPEESEAYDAYVAELEKRQREHDEYQRARHDEMLAGLRARTRDYLLHVAVKEPEELRALEADLSYNSDDLRPRVVKRWREFLDKASPDDPVFGPWKQLSTIASEQFAEARAAIGAAPDSNVNRLVLEALASQSPASMAELAAVYGELLSRINEEWLARVSENAATPMEVAAANGGGIDSLADGAAEEIRQTLYGEKSPLAIDLDEGGRLLDRDVRNELTRLHVLVDELKTTSPAAPARAMVLNDAEKPHDPQVFLRGNPARAGPAVPRQFLAMLTGKDRQPFEQGSGRLELARAIASPDNPLTARVIVNRVWMHHFGRGLVETPSDFGSRAEPPSHPELLDHLAADFIAARWSLKSLHRQIILSSAYQQASGDRAEARAVDPENRLIWRMPRRRLEFETLRDSLLAAAGRLDTALGGRSVDVFSQPYTPRRAVYAYIDRQDLPGAFRVFDLPSPDASAPKRAETTVPQQALFAMNSPFVAEQAQALAARSAAVAGDDVDARVREIYRAVLSRDPDGDEAAIAAEFVNAAAASPAGQSDFGPWDQLAQALLMSNEFAFVD